MSITLPMLLIFIEPYPHAISHLTVGNFDIVHEVIMNVWEPSVENVSVATIGQDEREWASLFH